MMRIFNAMVLNTCGRKKDEKHVKNLDGCLKVPLFDNAMPCSIDGKISLVLKHQYIVPSTLLALATNIRTYKATKIHTLTPLTYVSKNVHVRIFGAKPVVAARSFLLSILYFITSLGWKFSNRTKRDC